MTTSTTRRSASTAAAACGALLIWLVCDPLAGVDLSVGSGSSVRTVGPAAVTGASLLAGLAATGLAALLTRATARPRRNWLIAAGVVLAVSLLGPLGARSAGAGTALIAMHLAVGAILIVGIRGTLPDETRETS